METVRYECKITRRPFPPDNYFDEDALYDWFTDDENRELDDEIEDINGNMLDTILGQSNFIAVLFLSKPSVLPLPLLRFLFFFI